MGDPGDLSAFLHARSHFSLMDGARSPEAVCEWAASSGYRSLAICDRNAFYGLPETVDAAAARGLKAIAAACVAPDGVPRCTAYCLDARGYERLCGVLSRVLARECALGRVRAVPASDSFLYDSAAADEELPVHGGARGKVRHERIEGREAPGGRFPDPAIVAYDPISDFVEGGWDGLALVAHDGRTLLSLARAPRRGELYVGLDSGYRGAATARAAAERGIPAIALQDARVFGPGDRERLALLAAVDRRLTLDALGRSSWAPPPGRAEALPRSRLSARFSAHPEAIRAALSLAERAADAGSFFAASPVMPPWDGDAARELRARCEAALPSRYGPDRIAEARSRLERELAIIVGKGFAGYFLVVRDIVARCPRTCGRGSAASSVVSYLLSLTHVDPVGRNLFFERFLNEGRTDPPDIDIDFPWDERPAVLDYVMRRYAGSCGMVADHCSFARRGAIREAGLALGMDAAEIARGERLDRAGEAMPAFLAEAARLLLGVPRYIGTHPGGVVIVPGPIFARVHVQPSAAGLPVIAWEKDGTERAGLVKIDLLGNRSLAVLRDCVAAVNVSRVEEGMPPVTWEAFDPIDDPEARALLESGETVGIFYVESPATRQLLARMGTADFERLVIASSIIRPAANRCIDDYVRALRGGSRRIFSPAVEAVLGDTLGVMVYQEDVSRVAIAAAGFDAVEADRLRKTLSKKRGGVSIDAWRERFLAGCAARGESDRDARDLWEMMLSFRGYSFCKAHSASYVHVSYRCAWMKARYPAVFMAAVLNNGGGFYSAQAYVDEARRLGVEVLPPDVAESGAAFEPSADGRSIRFGLARIADLRARCVDDLLAARERGPFSSFADFLARVRPSRSDISALVRSGALDGLPAESGEPPLNRPAMLWTYEAFRLGKYGPPSLFPRYRVPDCVRDYDEAHKLLDERETLGLILSRHPARLFASRAVALAARLGLPDPVDSSALSGAAGRRVSVAGAFMAGKELLDARGRPMCFLSLYDESGPIEAVVFPRAYARAPALLDRRDAYLVVGTVQEREGTYAVHADGVYSLCRDSG